MNIKKMFTTLSAMVVAVTMTLPSASVFGATYSQELQDAYNWAHENGVTTMDSIDNANMYGAITRAQMAKMLSVYAEEIQGKTPDTSKACTFSDIDSVKGDLHDFIIESCQLGIMGQGISAFRPYDTISRAEFGTALSRVLWGNEYEGGTPYYAKHLDALKAAGIMTQIDNPENRDEVRGYVMLMLMRAAEGVEGVDCEDPAIALACAMETDECPAACREDAQKDDENEVVKSGDLEVSVEANKWADAFLYGWVSDLDAINFKASEEWMTVTKVTLERFGYSSSDDVEVVWLEDENGTRITDPKELNSKDQVTLSILKDYRELDETDTMTIVLQTYDGKKPDGSTNADYKPGSSIWFKVVDIETSAANVDASDIKGNPYLYDLVSYNGSDIVFTYKGKNNTYHLGEGPYEVFRFKLKASSTSAALVRWFDITNVSTKTHLDLEDFVEDVIVTVNDEEIKSTYTIDDDKISISFDEVEVAAKENAIFAVNVELSDDFDELESAVLFELDEASDLKVTEKKTGARVGIDNFEALASTAEYIFNWSKLSLSNKKLGTVNMAAGSDDVAIAEWTIELGGQSLVVAANTITVVATSDTQLVKKGANVDGAWIEAMRLVVAGEEFDAKCENTASKVTTCVFNKKMTIEKEGKLQIVVDVDDDATKDSKVEFTIAGKKLLGKTTIGTDAKGYVNGLTYEDSKKWVLASDFVGSVTLYDLKVTAAKAAMENKITNPVDFKLDTTTSKVTVFEGTYTAKKQDLTITDVNYTPVTALLDPDDSVTLNLYINDKLVASTDIDKDDAKDVAVNDSTTRVNVKAGETVNVRVEADVYAAKENTVSYKVELVGEDTDGNKAGEANDYTVDMKFVKQGSADVDPVNNSTHKQKDVLLRASNLPLAAFRVSASNWTVDLDDMLFTITTAPSCTNGVLNDAGDACKTLNPTFHAAVPEELYTPATAATKNATLTGAVAAGAACASGCASATYTADEAAAYNATLDGAVASGDVKTAAADAYCEDGGVINDTGDGCLTASYVAKTPVKADAIRVKINGEDVDTDKVSNSGDQIAVKDIAENDIDDKWVEVVISLKWNPAAAPYVTTLDQVNEDDKGIIFNKNIVPALLLIEQADKGGSTEYKFTVKKYETSNNVSNVCLYLTEGETESDANTAKRCLMSNVSNGSTLEVEGTDGVKFIQKITYTVAGTNGGSVEIKKGTYNDYFRVGDTYLKIFDKD